MFDMMKMMKQAQAMKERMATLQEEVAAMELTGVAGGGLVSVTLSGKGDLKAVKIDASLMKAEEVEIVEDLIAAAHADAKTKAEAALAERTQALMGSLGLPEGMKLPF
jgi:DNA-binding YbaB/EbfC family protein